MSKTGTHASSKGVALISVLLLLALLSTLAIFNMEKQDLAIRKVSNQRTSEQAFQIATGGEQWAIKLLEKDLEVDNEDPDNGFDHAGENWANLGGAVKVEGTESSMQIAISDEQGKFNINNLIQGKVLSVAGTREQQPEEQTEEQNLDQDDENNEGEQEESVADSDDSENGDTEESDTDTADQEGEQGGERSTPGWYTLFQKLLFSLDIDPALADVVVDWIDENDETTGTTGAEDLFYTSLESPYRAANQQLSSVSELRYLRGFSPDIVNRLLPYVTAIPVSSVAELTTINVNTASTRILSLLADEVLATEDYLIPLVEKRQVEPYKSVGDFISAFEADALVPLTPGIASLIDVKSSYFVSRSCALTDRVKLSQLSLLKRDREREKVTVQYRFSNYGCPEIL